MEKKNGTSADCKDDQNVQEFIRCCLGGVTMGISAPLQIHKDLSTLQNRLEDFHSDRSLNLRLNILKATPTEKKQDRQHAKNSIISHIQKMMEREVPGIKRELLRSAAPRLELLLSAPAIDNRLKLLNFEDNRISFVPLELGFLCVDLSKGEGLLLLDEGRHARGSTADTNWFPRFHITTVNAIMAFLAIYLAERGDGMIVHGTGVSCRGKGYVFLAPSGGGKTTLSKQSRPGSVLADDGLIIREKKGYYTLYPTPFRQHPPAEAGPWSWQQFAVALQAAFFLDKGPQTSLRYIERPLALSLLINAFTHFSMWMKPHLSIKVFDFWRQFCEKIPIAAIEWQKGTDIWPEIQTLFYTGNKENENKKEASMAGRI